jgi:hypothetical protein
MEIAFAGLHQLCTPMLSHLAGLPGPQRDALGTVFGLSTGQAPDRLLVGLALLGLLSEAAEDQPLVCLVDDAQWLDQASAQAQALAFVARRLLAERVALVFAVRDPSEMRPLGDLPPLMVEGLKSADASALLDSVTVRAARFGLCERQALPELTAGADAELGEHLVQVVLRGPGADEQAGPV